MEPKMIPIAGRLNDMLILLSETADQAARVRQNLQMTPGKECGPECAPGDLETKLTLCENRARAIRDQLCDIEDVLFGTADASLPKTERLQPMNRNLAYTDKR